MSFDDILQNVELALVKVIPSSKNYSEVQKARKLAGKICEDCDAQEQDYINIIIVQKSFIQIGNLSVKMWALTREVKVKQIAIQKQ